MALELRSVALLEAVRSAFVNGMDVSLVVAAGIALTGLVLALLFLPARSSRAAERAAKAAEVLEPVAAADGQRVELENEEGAIRS